MAAAAGLTVTNNYYNQAMLGRLAYEFELTAGTVSALPVVALSGYMSRELGLPVSIIDLMVTPARIALTITPRSRFALDAAKAPETFGVGYDNFDDPESRRLVAFPAEARPRLLSPCCR